MVWRYAYCFLRILKLFFLHFNLDIFSSLYATDMYREYVPCIGNPAYSFRPILLKLYRYFAAFLWFHMRNLSLAGYNCSGGASCMACSFIFLLLLFKHFGCYGNIKVCIDLQWEKWKLAFTAVSLQIFWQKFYRNVPWVVLYKTYLFCCNLLIWLVTMATKRQNLRTKFPSNARIAIQQTKCLQYNTAYCQRPYPNICVSQYIAAALVKREVKCKKWSIGIKGEEVQNK